MKNLLLLVAFFFSCAYNTATVQLTDEIVCVNREGKHYHRIENIDFLTFDAIDFIEQKKDTLFIDLNSGNNYFIALQICRVLDKPEYEKSLK